MRQNDPTWHHRSHTLLCIDQSELTSQFHDFEEDFCIGHHYPNDYNRSIAPGLVRAAISHFPSADETIRSHPCPAESKNGPFTNIGQFLLRTLIGSANNSPVTPDTLDTKEADPDVKFDTFARNKSLSSVFIRKITPFTPYEVKTRTEELEKTGYARDALLWRTEMRHNTPCSVITGPESRITWLKDHLEMLDKDCERYNDPAKEDELRELDTLCAYF